MNKSIRRSEQHAKSTVVQKKNQCVCRTQKMPAEKRIYSSQIPNDSSLYVRPSNGEKQASKKSIRIQSRKNGRERSRRDSKCDETKQIRNKCDQPISPVLRQQCDQKAGYSMAKKRINKHHSSRKTNDGSGNRIRNRRPHNRTNGTSNRRTRSKTNWLSEAENTRHTRRIFQYLRQR